MAATVPLQNRSQIIIFYARSDPYDWQVTIFLEYLLLIVTSLRNNVIIVSDTKCLISLYDANDIVI
jgi:hypothetical protein